jgi:5-methylcytosine-specific restriction enzyme subunit McrC
MARSSSSRRLSIVEYGPATKIPREAARLGITQDALQKSLEQTARRMSDVLGVADPLWFERDGFRVGGVAGLIRLTNGLELEVCPKFLDPADPGWRDDFFLIATLTRYGRVLPKDALQSEAKEKYSLGDLIALTVLEMYEANQARPLRVYKKRTWKSFDIDGELDSESLLAPDESGFLQEGIFLDRKNQYNQVIYHAVSVLLPEVRDGDVRRKLSEVRLRLAPQNSRPRARPGTKRLPPRHSRWQDLYDLSTEVLRGFGVGFRDRAQVFAPGFVLRTANAWETLLRMAVRSVMTDRIVLKTEHPLGARTRSSDGKVALVRVTPDMTVRRSGGLAVPVDAKYKGRIGPDGFEQIGISNADLYETLAFMDATNAKLSVLLYPKPGTNEPRSVGACDLFERIEVGDRLVLGATVEIRGISGPNGLRSFSLAVADALRESGA